MAYMFSYYNIIFIIIIYYAACGYARRRNGILNSQSARAEECGAKASVAVFDKVGFGSWQSGSKLLVLH
jgi:hypothetical protein